MSLDLVRDPIPKLLRATSIPAITGMFFGTLYNIVDTIYVGHYSTNALAAFSMVFPVYFIFLLATAVGFSNGLKTVIAEAIGRNSTTEVRCLIAQGIPLGVITGLMINLLAYSCIDYLLLFLENKQDPNNSDNLMLAKEYLEVLFLGGISLNIVYALTAPLGAIGDTKTLRDGEIFGAFANIILNPILMFGWFGLPEMGIAGLALATVIIWTAHALYCFIRLRNSALWSTFNLADIRPIPALWGRILLQAVPSIINMVRIGIIFSIFAYVMNTYGTNVLAGYGVGFRIEGLFILPVVGLNVAVVAIVAQNYGAADHARVREAYLMTLKVGLAIMFIGGAILIVFAPWLVIPFTDDAETRQYAIEYLRIDAVALPSIAIINLSGAMMQGMQRTMLGVAALMLTQALLPAILLPYVAQHYGYSDVWWTMVGILWFSALCMLVIVHLVLKSWKKTLPLGGSMKTG